MRGLIVKAFAVLGGIVVALGVVPNHGFALAAHEYDETEISALLPIEYIEVAHCPIQVKYQLTLQNPAQQRSTYFATPEGRMAASLLGADIARAGSGIVGRQGKIKPRRNVRLNQPNTRNDLNVLGWGCAVIDYLGLEFESDASALLHYATAFNGDVGPQLTFGSFLRQQPLVFAGDPKLIGGKPKAYSGYRQNDGETTNHALVVRFEEGIGLFEGKRRSNVEGGAIFWVIVIGGLLAVLWLYQAQR